MLRLRKDWSDYMKLYVVTCDKYEEDTGCDLYLLGVFTSKKRAKDCIDANKEYNPTYIEVDADTNVNRYIDGYIF